jgi:glycosylphosphatidylinositol transamidase (GPIT) subunit GPI8
MSLMIIFDVFERNMSFLFIDLFSNVQNMLKMEADRYYNRSFEEDDNSFGTDSIDWQMELELLYDAFDYETFPKEILVGIY